MGSQKLRLPSSKKFTTSIVRGFESPWMLPLRPRAHASTYGKPGVSSVLDAASSAGFALSKKPLSACSRRWTSSACLPILDVLWTPKFAVASGETHDKNNGQHWGSPLSVRAGLCCRQCSLLEAPERRDQADDRRPSRRALRRRAGTAAAAADHRDACSGTRARGGILVLAASCTQRKYLDQLPPELVRA